MHPRPRALNVSDLGVGASDYLASRDQERRGVL